MLWIYCNTSIDVFHVVLVTLDIDYYSPQRANSRILGCVSSIEEAEINHNHMGSLIYHISIVPYPTYSRISF